MSTMTAEITAHKVEIPAALFLAGVNSVIGCADRDSTMPALNAVRITWTEGEITFVATDRYVLAEHTFPLGAMSSGDAGGAVSVPLATLATVLGMVKLTSPALVTIVAGDGSQASPASVLGVSFVPAGEFPRYLLLFPLPAEYVEIGTTIVGPAKVMQLAGPKVKSGRSVAKFPDLRFTFAKPSGSGSYPRPITVHRVGVEGFRGILMPVREAN